MFESTSCPDINPSVAEAIRRPPAYPLPAAYTTNSGVIPIASAMISIREVRLRYQHHVFRFSPIMIERRLVLPDVSVPAYRASATPAPQCHGREGWASTTARSDPILQCADRGRVVSDLPLHPVEDCVIGWSDRRRETFVRHLKGGSWR